MWYYGQQPVIWLFVCYVHEGKVSCNLKKWNFVHVMHWQSTCCIILLSIQATCCEGECLSTKSCVQLPGPLVKATGQLLFASSWPPHGHPWSHIACKRSQSRAGTLGCVGPQMPKCLGGQSEGWFAEQGLLVAALLKRSPVLWPHSGGSVALGIWSRSGGCKLGIQH